MTDIELVIKIPQETYEYWKNHSHEYVIAEAICKGTILPEGQGRLIDESKITEIRSTGPQWMDNSEGFGVCVQRIISTNAPTIIEADKGE